MKKIIGLLVVAFALCLNIKIGNADIGPKPSIEITIKNIDTDNYIIDLFTYDQKGKDYKCEYKVDNAIAKEYEEELKLIYKLNYDNWISMSTRSMSCFLLFTEPIGNKNHTHIFSYFETPEEYKVLIKNLENGEIRLTDKIVRTDFNSIVDIDYNEMSVVQKADLSLKNLLISIAIILITVIVEVFVAYLIKIKSYKIIIVTNVVSNVLLQLGLHFNPFAYLTTLGVLEFIVIVAEYLVYKIIIKLPKKNKKSILLYTVIANVITLILTFFIQL